MKALSHKQPSFDKLPTDAEYWKRRRRWSYSGSSVPSEKKEESLEASSIADVIVGDIADKFFYGSYSSLNQGYSITANRSNHHTPNGYDVKKFATLPCTDGYNDAQVMYGDLNHGLKSTTNWCSVTHVAPKTIPSCSSCSTYCVMSSCYSSPRMSNWSISNCQSDNLQRDITESFYDVKKTVNDQGRISRIDNSTVEKGCIQNLNFASNVHMLCNDDEDLEYHKKFNTSSENTACVDIKQSRKSFNSCSALKSKSLTSIAAYAAATQKKGVSGDEGSGFSLPLSSEPCDDLMSKVDGDFKKRLSSLKFGIGPSRFKTPLVIDNRRHNDLLYAPRKDLQADEFKDRSQNDTWKDKEKINNNPTNSNPRSPQMNKLFDSNSFVDSFNSKKRLKNFIQCDRNALRTDQIPVQVCEIGHHVVTDTIIQKREKFDSKHSGALDIRSLKDKANINSVSLLLPVKNFESRCIQLTSNAQIDGVSIQNEFNHSTASEKLSSTKDCLSLKCPKTPAENRLAKVHSYHEGTPADFDETFTRESFSETPTSAFRRSFTIDELNNMMSDGINRGTADKQPAISHPRSPRDYSHKEILSTDIQTILSQNDASMDTGTSVTLEMQVNSNIDVIINSNRELPVKEIPSTAASKGAVVLDKLQAVEKLDRRNEKIERHLKRTEADIEVLNEIIREACHRLEVKCQLKQKLLKEKSRIANKRDSISKESLGIRDCPSHSSGTVLDFTVNAGSAVVLEDTVKFGDFRKNAGLLEKTIIQRDDNIVIPVHVTSHGKCLSPSSADTDPLIFSKAKTSQEFLHNSADGINFRRNGRDNIFECKLVDVPKDTVWSNPRSEIVHSRVRSASVPPRQRRKTKKTRNLLHSRSSAVQLICSDASDSNLCESRSRSPSPVHSRRRKRTSPTKEYLHRSSSSDVDIEGLDSFKLVTLNSFPHIGKNDESAERV